MVCPSMLKSYVRNQIQERKNTRGVFEKNFALNVVRKVTKLVIVRVIPLPPWEKAGIIEFA